MFYYLYEIKNNINGKIYRGVHKTSNLDDGYMGSGTVIIRAIAKHGIENFTKVILEQFDNEVAMFAREKEVVNDEFLARDDVYNLRRGGFGGFEYINKNGLNAAKLNPKFGADNHFYGKQHTEETKQFLRDLYLGKPRDPFTEEHKQKIAESLKGHKVTDETAKKISEAKKGKPAANKGKPAPVHLCMHCNKEIAGYSNFTRWHGDNCKERKQ